MAHDHLQSLSRQDSICGHMPIFHLPVSPTYASLSRVQPRRVDRFLSRRRTEARSRQVIQCKWAKVLGSMAPQS
jgi:hypothetical protein